MHFAQFEVLCRQYCAQMTKQHAASLVVGLRTWDTLSTRVAADKGCPSFRMRLYVFLSWSTYSREMGY